MQAERSDCGAVSEFLATVGLDSTGGFGPAERAHIEYCIRCQAEHSTYRRLLRAMQSLRDTPPLGVAGLDLEILGNIDEKGPPLMYRARIRAMATLGGMAAGAVGAAGVIAYAARQRRHGRLAS